MQVILLEDTRQKIGKHEQKHRWFEENGYIIRRTKLYVGDYQLATDGSRAVDTKQDVLELIGDVHAQHARFREELLRAQEAGIKLLVLVEEMPPDGDLLKWKSPRWYYGKLKGFPKTRTKMPVFQKALVTLAERYGVEFRFCRKEDAAKITAEYLKG